MIDIFAIDGILMTQTDSYYLRRDSLIDVFYDYSTMKTTKKVIPPKEKVARPSSLPALLQCCSPLSTESEAEPNVLAAHLQRKLIPGNFSLKHSIVVSELVDETLLSFSAHVRSRSEIRAAAFASRPWLPA